MVGDRTCEFGTLGVQGVELGLQVSGCGGAGFVVRQGCGLGGLEVCSRGSIGDELLMQVGDGGGLNVDGPGQLIRVGLEAKDEDESGFYDFGDVHGVIGVKRTFTRP